MSTMSCNKSVLQKNYSIKILDYDKFGKPICKTKMRLNLQKNLQCVNKKNVDKIENQRIPINASTKNCNARKNVTTSRRKLWWRPTHNTRVKLLRRQNETKENKKLKEETTL
jgi:hypothetical protein